MPHSGDPDTECFNPIVDTLGLPEILGANIHEKIYRWPWLNKERAYVQLVSKLLGVEFDAIWQRHKRQLIRNIIVWTIGALIVLATLLGVWIANQPVDVEVRLNEASVHNDNLPPLENAVVTMTLDNETKVDTVRSLDSGIIFKNIPHRFINDKVRVRVECQNFLTTDTIMVLSDHVSIDVRRDPEVFGNVHFKLWNPDTEQISPNTEVNVASHSVKSDANGYVMLSIPLSEQKTVYPISSTTTTLVDDTVVLPCGPDDVIVFK